MSVRRCAFRWLLAVAVVLVAATANADTYPTQPVKSNPGKLTYASAGAGTASHLAGEMLRKFADVDIVHVPYRGSPPANVQAWLEEAP